MKNIFKNIDLSNIKTGLVLLSAAVAVLTGHQIDIATISGSIGTAAHTDTISGLIPDLLNTTANIYHWFV